MGLKSNTDAMRVALEARFPELLKRTSWGARNIPRNVSTPWIIVVPGGGVADILEGADNQDRAQMTSVPRQAAKDVRLRMAAGFFWIFGKNYTEAEAYLHEVIALIHFHNHGRGRIGNPLFINEGAGDLAQYGEHFRLPFWVQMNVFEWQPPSAAEINSVQVARAGVSADPEIPSNPPTP